MPFAKEIVLKRAVICPKGGTYTGPKSTPGKNSSPRPGKVVSSARAPTLLFRQGVFSPDFIPFNVVLVFFLRVENFFWQCGGHFLGRGFASEVRVGVFEAFFGGIF